MSKYRTLFDFTFRVDHDCKDPHDISTKEIIEALQERVKYSIDALRICKTTEQGCEFSDKWGDYFGFGPTDTCELWDDGTIDSWDDVPVGSKVIEDTYNEVYEVFMKDGQRWLRQVGWQVGNQPVPQLERPADFEPNCMYDQPWIVIK